MTSDVSNKRTAQSVNRKISKGVIERKRRARINRSLAELKFIILNESKDKGLHSKLDKAEILERTLTYLQALQKPQHNPIHTYRDGFLACVKEMDHFLSVEHIDEISKQKLANHLVFCSSGLDHIAQQANFQRSIPAMANSLPATPPPQHNYATVPQSPSPSLSGSSYYGSSYPSSPKSEPVWRPW